MAAPERFAKKSDLLLQRGHRPYMALNCLDGERMSRQLLGVKQPPPGLDRAAVIDPKRSSLRFVLVGCRTDPIRQARAGE